VLLVGDGCGSHKTPAVVAAIEREGLALELFPPNMTDILQPMDLTVNGPLKAAIRRARCKALFYYFQGWRLKHALAQLGVPEGLRDSVPLPAYKPPMPTLEDGLRTLFATLNERFTTPEFRDGLRRTFQHVGLAPVDDLGAYVNYTMHVERSNVRKTKQARALIMAEDPEEKDETFLAADLLPEGCIEDIEEKFEDESGDEDEDAVVVEDSDSDSASDDSNA